MFHYVQQCFTMFSESCKDRHRRLHHLQSLHWLPGSSQSAITPQGSAITPQESAITLQGLTILPWKWSHANVRPEDLNETGVTLFLESNFQRSITTYLFIGSNGSIHSYCYIHQLTLPGHLPVVQYHANIWRVLAYFLTCNKYNNVKAVTWKLLQSLKSLLPFLIYFSQ